MTNKVILITIFMLLITFPSFSSDRVSIFIDNGNKAYNNDNYKSALNFYNLAIEEGSEDAIIWYRRAYCIEKTKTFNEAWYSYKGALKRLSEQNREHRYFEYAKNKVLSDKFPPSENLIYSTEFRLWKEAKKYLEEAENINISYKSGETPLFFSIKHENSEVAKLLLKSGADPNIKATWGEKKYGEHEYEIYPLGLAAINGQEDVIQSLLDAGAKIDTININDKESGTPLTFAIKEGNDKSAFVLIENGAYPNSENYNPIYEAIHSEENEILKVLLNYGGDPNLNREISLSANNNINTVTVDPLIYSIVNNKITSLRILLEKGAKNISLEKENNYKHFVYSLPVFTAIHTHNIKALKVLYEHEIDLSINAFGQDVFTHAVAYGTTEIVKYLIDAGIKREDTNNIFYFCPLYPLKNFDLNYVVSKDIISPDYNHFYTEKKYFIHEPTLFEAAIITGNIDNLKFIVSELNYSIKNTINYSFNEDKNNERKEQIITAINKWIIDKGVINTVKYYEEKQDLDKSERESFDKYKELLNRYNSTIKYIENFTN